MPTYKVIRTIYRAECLGVEVEAENKAEALAMAEEELSNFSDAEYEPGDIEDDLTVVEIQEVGKPGWEIVA